MTYALTQKQSFAIMNKSLAEAITGCSALAKVTLVDKELSPEFQGGAKPARRETFQAHSDGERKFRCIVISPPTDMIPALLDWSRDGMPAAKLAAKSCAAIYGRIVADMERFGDAKQDPLDSDAVFHALESSMSEASRAMHLHGASLGSAPVHPAFAAECSRAAAAMPGMGEVEGLAWKAALRDWAYDIDPSSASAMLAQAPLAFTPLLSAFGQPPSKPPSEPLNAPRRSLLANASAFKLAGKPIVKPMPYVLFRNGSFSSSAHLQSDQARGIAEPFALDPHLLGLEHGVHRHFLATPDGEIHGAANIKVWADSVLALREGMEISSQVKLEKLRSRRNENHGDILQPVRTL